MDMESPQTHVMHANPSKFYILSLGFPDIEMKQGFIIGVYLLYSYGVSFTGVQEGLIVLGTDCRCFAPRSIAKVRRWPGYSPCFLGEYCHVVVLGKVLHRSGPILVYMREHACHKIGFP